MAEEEKIYCPYCKEETVHSPRGNDVACGSYYLTCDKCNRHRA